MSATDRARRALESIYRHDGKAALYGAPSTTPSVACTVLLDSPDEEIEQVGGRLVARGDILKVRASEVTPVKGGSFVVTGIGTFKVLGDPWHDEDPERLEFTMTAAKSA